MDKLGRIIIAIFVLNNTLYDLIAKFDNVKLNIVFFCLMYFCFFLICVGDIIKNNFKDTFSLLMGIGFTIRIIIELTKWNMSYDGWLTSVNTIEQGLLFSFLTISLLVIYFSHERRKRKNN